MRTTFKKSLANKVNSAKSIEELELIVNSIPRQENGEKLQITRILEDTFWYIDIKTTEQAKEFMNKKIQFYL